MARPQPTIDDIGNEVAALLREVEIGALAVVQPDGSPLVATMHFAGDGFAAYVHTFTYTRKFAALERDPRVSYTLAYQPPGGFYERQQLRAIQVNGRATRLTEGADIDRAIEVSGQQFAWLKDSSMFDNFRREGIELRQTFYRVDPEVAMWNDNRVRMQWRKLLTFSPDGTRITAVDDYTAA